MGSLMACKDLGPWKCSIEGCPAPLQGCDSLAGLGFCEHAFASVWSPPPEGITADMRVSDLCPRACGLCGVDTPSHCTMRVIEGDAATTSIDDVIETLLTSTTPIVVKWSVAIALEMRRLLAVHQSMRVAVVTQGGRYRGDAMAEKPIPYGDFAPALQNRSLPHDAYIFYELGGLQAHSHSHGVNRKGRLELAGPEVSPEARLLVDGLPEFGRLLGSLLRRTNELSPHAMDGRLLLSAGTWGNGRPFHAHGPALFALAFGSKRWFVRRPNATFEWQRFEVGRTNLRESEALPEGWEEQLWQCTQSAGDLVWVPDQLHHATLNYASEVIGFAMVMDDAETFTPLHTAAQSGAADELRALLRSGHHRVDTVAAANGATPLHFASGLGHCEAVEVLLGAGADVDVKAAQGLTPLHVAVAGGHEQAALLLVSRGGEALTSRNEHGLTPIELGRQLGHSGVVRALEEAARRLKITFDA